MLGQHLGSYQVFRDIDSIEPGIDFVEAIERELDTCEVMLVLISRTWRTATDETGQPRLQDPNDYVRLEVATALGRRDIRVIPVLLQGASMPRVKDLPDDLAALARRNAVELRDTSFPTDVEKLATILKRVLSSKGQIGQPKQAEAPPTEHTWEAQNREEEEQLRQYRERVEAFWVDEELSKGEAESLSDLANKLRLSPDTAADVEREVMGDTKEAIIERQDREREATERRKQLEELYAQARQLHQNQEWQAVVGVFNQIRAINPEYPDAEELLLSAREALAAQRRLERRANSMYERGLTYIESEEWAQALRCFEELQRLEPGYRKTEELLSRVRSELADDIDASGEHEQQEATREWEKGLSARTSIDKRISGGSYNTPASSTSPALVIYLFDISTSMQQELDGLPKIEHANQAIEKVLRRMVQRSTKGEVISPRYRLAMIAYSEQPYDILGGIQTIDQVVRRGKPRLSADTTADAAAAFMVARELLMQELPYLRGHPAPMVCHLTDGKFTGSDPEPIAQEIMHMANDDGNVLVENIYLGSELTTQPISDPYSWPGVSDIYELKSRYAKKLFNMSSPLPDSYVEMINEEGYELEPGSRMLIPGTNYDLIELALAMSSATATYDVKAVNLAPDDAKAWHNKGKALFESGYYEEALETTEKIVRLNPDYLAAWVNKGSALLKLSRYEEALEAAEKAIDLNPNEPRAWDNKGWTLYNLGRFREAQKAYEEVNKLRTR